MIMVNISYFSLLDALLLSCRCLQKPEHLDYLTSLADIGTTWKILSISRCSMPFWMVTLNMLMATASSSSPARPGGRSSYSGPSGAALCTGSLISNLLRALLATSCSQSSSRLSRSTSSLWFPLSPPSCGPCFSKLSSIHLLSLAPLDDCACTLCASTVVSVNLLCIISAALMSTHWLSVRLRLHFGHCVEVPKN